MKVVYGELALADLDQIFQYLDARTPASARNVAAAIKSAISDIADHPLAARGTSDPAGATPHLATDQQPTSLAHRTTLAMTVAILPLSKLF